MRFAPEELLLDFIETRVKRIEWLSDNGFYEDAEFLHKETMELVGQLDKV